jgi:hypothetical protein
MGSPDSLAPNRFDKLVFGVAGEPSRLKNLNDEFQDAK